MAGDGQYLIAPCLKMTTLIFLGGYYVSHETKQALFNLNELQYPVNPDC